MARIDEDDEEAFHWAGDEVGGREGARLPSEQVRDAVADSSGNIATAESGLQSGRASPALTFLSGALYLVLTVGWILGVQYTGSGSTELWTEVLWQFGEFTAIVAAPLWFGATLTLTRSSRLVTRLGWLALGTGLLVPWPVLPLLAAASA